MLRELGRSNNVVYEAEEPDTGRRVALKVMELPPTLSGSERTQRVERFQTEARAASRMSHPNIVETYETGQEKGRLFVAMEFLEGKSLARVLREEGKLNLERAGEILSQMCAALTYAHSRGVVHRDVKPSNVMILPGGRVKLTDFGIARIRGDPRMTMEGQTLGTPYYMSPEQVKGQDVTSASDIFSCGVVFYEMLTGKKPFEGTNIAQIGLKIVEEEPTYTSDIPGPLVGVLRKAMAKYPAARFATAEEFAAAARRPPAQIQTVSPQPRASSAPAAAAAPVTVGPVDWTPEQSEAAWRRARGVAAAIVILILGFSLPSIYQEHKAIGAVKEVDKWLEQAVAAAQTGLWEEAVAKSDRAMRFAPQGSYASVKARSVWSRICLDYAERCLETMRPDEAARVAGEVIERGLGGARAHLLRGKAYLALGETGLARQDLEISTRDGGSTGEEARRLLRTLGMG